MLDLQRHKEGWEGLVQMDCIISGFDYATSEYVHFISDLYTITNSIPHSEENNPYGMNQQLLEIYEAHVTQLACNTQFWSPSS